MQPKTAIQDRVPGGGNQAVSQLRSEFRDLTPEERLTQAAHLSEAATSLAALRAPAGDPDTRLPPRRPTCRFCLFTAQAT